MWQKEITIDITDVFCSDINHDCFFEYAERNNYVFFNYPLVSEETFEFELINFGINLSDYIWDELKANGVTIDKAKTKEEMAYLRFM